MRDTVSLAPILATILIVLAACTSRAPVPVPAEPIPPIPANTWREIKEAVWTASTLAQREAETSARDAMRAWMSRVREETEQEFVPWYISYWTQQWIGFKAGWYEMNKEDGDPPVEEYLTTYLLERYHELVLEPAGKEGHPQMITEQTAALFVRLLSEQLQCLPKTYRVSRRALDRDLRQIPLISPQESQTDSISLSQLLVHRDLAGAPGYDALVTRTGSVGERENPALDNTRLRAVIDDTVARLLAELPVRAGGNAVGLTLGEALGLFVGAGITVWSAISHEESKPEMELQLREALREGLDQMWQVLMEDPELGVVYPVRHMKGQIDTGLFDSNEPDSVMPF